MSTCISLADDQIPLSLALRPNPQIPECRPAVTDITLYGESSVAPVAHSRPAQNPTKGILSFKDWKEKQDLLMRVPKVVVPDAKQVRFNDLPAVNLTQPTSLPVTSVTAHSTNLQSRPPICKSLELSVCEPVAAPQVRPVPLMQGLFNKAAAGHLLFQQQQKQYQHQNEAQCNNCNCQSKPQFVAQTPQFTALPEPAEPDLKQQVSSMQRQLNLLQSQVAELLKMHSPKPSAIDSGTQCTPLRAPPVAKVDIGVNTTQIPETDQTFFNHVLGQVNQILQQTNDSNDGVKFIESDVSAESIPTPNNKICHNVKKATDKSTFVNALAEKYLGKNSEPKSQTNQATLDIDVSTTCYNYMQKYDLLKADDGGSKKGWQKTTLL